MPAPDSSAQPHPLPYQLTSAGHQILAAAQALRASLGSYARAEQNGVLSIVAAKPGIADMFSAMRKTGFDMLYVDDLPDEFEDISERGCRAFEEHAQDLAAPCGWTGGSSAVGAARRGPCAFELHFFAGLTPGKIADRMQVSERTAARDIGIAKAWLFERLKQSAAATPVR